MAMLLDVQCFIGHNMKFVPKEVAVINVNGQGLGYIIFKPPYDLASLPLECRATNVWLAHNHHGISWNAGNKSHEDVPKIVRKMVRNGCYVYVKGEEKKAWLTKIIDGTTRVIHMEDLHITAPALEKLRHMEAAPCHDLNHGYFPSNNLQQAAAPGSIWYDDNPEYIPAYNCAFENVQRLRSWYLKECTSFIEKSFRLYKELDGLRVMMSEDIAFLPREFIYTFASNAIKDVWDKLSENTKMDDKIASCRRCLLHYTPGPDGDIVDGPNPLVKDCLECNRLPKKCSQYAQKYQ